MSTDKQRHQPIALADILLDQDSFNSEADIESQARNLARIHIHTDMSEARYHSVQPSTCSSVTPTTLAYHQDMTPFTSVSLAHHRSEPTFVKATCRSVHRKRQIAKRLTTGTGILLQLPCHRRHHPFDTGFRRGVSSSPRTPSAESGHEERIPTVFEQLPATYTAQHIQGSGSLWLRVLRRSHYFVFTPGYAVSPI